MATHDRSFWGWGLADRWPSDKERAELAELLESMLGFPERPLLDPPRIEEVELPEARLEAPGSLADHTTSARHERIMHTYGRGYRDLVRGFRGIFEHAPDLVARPATEEQVHEVLAWASEHQVAVLPYGGGTSVVGGVEAAVGNGYAGAICLDVTRMDQVLDVDAESRLARIQAGATGPQLNEQLADHGVVLRHYPQSYEFSTLGGWIATRAGGHYATVYTRIDDLMHAARMLCPAGVLETRSVPSTGAGPDPKGLILGSEGILGVVTEARVRVVSKPEHRAKATVHFAAWEDGVQATRQIVQAGLAPANCRLLDPREAMLHRVAFDGFSVLVLGFEASGHPVDTQLDHALEVCTALGGEVQQRASPGTGGRRDQQGSGQGRWRQAFFDAPYLFNQLVSLAVVVDTFETACTWQAFPALHEAITRNLTEAMEEACGGGFLSCRFTHVYPDGPAPYYTFLAPSQPGEELDHWSRIKEAASRTLVQQGATITHHHAVGRVHRPWFGQEVPQLWLDALAAMKGVLDPAGVMNPGALLDPGRV